MSYRYETHLHTYLSSACSEFTPEQIVEKYVRLGYAGVCVTDHFMNGNTAVDRSLPYEEQIRQFCKGYRAVKNAPRGTGLSVFLGFEYGYLGTEFLVYGLDEEWLVSHPEIMKISVKEFCRLARDAGGLVVQAHPYRERFYIDHIRLYPSDVDGMETINANNTPQSNELADFLARRYGLKRMGGSDIHSVTQTHLAGIEFENAAKDVRDFVKRVLAGEGREFIADYKE